MGGGSNNRAGPPDVLLYKPCLPISQSIEPLESIPSTQSKVLPRDDTLLLNPERGRQAVLHISKVVALCPRLLSGAFLWPVDGD